MLVPAILFRDEIHKEFMKFSYEDEMMFYSGWLGNNLPEINDNSDEGHYQYAIVDNGKVVGYFDYRINWYNSCAHCFGLYSFDKNNSTIGIDVYRELRKLINKYRLHRIDWRMIGGNPVEKHYDRFMKKYNGKKFVLTDVLKDRQGKYHDDVIYEIINRRADNDT